MALTPYTALTTLADAIRATTDLHELSEIAGNTTTPHPERHRSFRLDPGEMRFFGAGSPGDVQLIRENVTVTLMHEADPGQDISHYQVASDDLVALLRAVLTRREFSGLGQPRPERVVRRRVGTVFEQSFGLTVQYQITLPATE